MNKLFLSNCLDIFPKIKKNSINLVFADPPYFLSNGGVSYKSGKIVSVNKGDWDKYTSKEDVYKFTRKWIFQCKRVLKENGSIFICGTHHNIFDVGIVLKELGFKVINLITWQKKDPPPLIYKNKFRFSTEHIIWAKPNKKHQFNYNKMYNINNKEMTDVWKMDAVRMIEKKYGKHPTQKPEELLRRIIEAASKQGDVVLDPFMGSGTTCVVAKKMKRVYIGIEKYKEYYNISKARIDSF